MNDTDSEGVAKLVSEANLPSATKSASDLIELQNASQAKSKTALVCFGVASSALISQTSFTRPYLIPLQSLA